MDTRVAVLETEVRQIGQAVGRLEGDVKENFKWMLGGFAAVIAVMIGTAISMTVAMRAEYRDVANVQTASSQAIGAANTATLAANSAVLEQITATREQIAKERVARPPRSAPPLESPAKTPK